MLAEAEQEYVAGEEDFWYQNGKLSRSVRSLGGRNWVADPGLLCIVWETAMTMYNQSRSAFLRSLIQRVIAHELRDRSIL